MEAGFVQPAIGEVADDKPPAAPSLGAKLLAVAREDAALMAGWEAGHRVIPRGCSFIAGATAGLLVDAAMSPVHVVRRLLAK